MSSRVETADRNVRTTRDATRGDRGARRRQDRAEFAYAVDDAQRQKRDHDDARERGISGATVDGADDGGDRRRERERARNRREEERTGEGNDEDDETKDDERTQEEDGRPVRAGARRTATHRRPHARRDTNGPAAAGERGGVLLQVR